MKLLKPISVLLLLSGVFLLSCVNTSGTTQKMDNNIPFPSVRAFEMAVCPLFVLKDIEERFMPLLEELASVSDIYFMQSEMIWDFEDGMDIDSTLYEINVINFLNISKNLGLKSGYVGISLFSEARDKILNNSFSQNFADVRIRKACKNMALRVVKDFKPKYFCFGIEVSSYFHKNPDDFKHFVTLYNEVYSAVKAISADTIIFPTFHFEEFSGILPWNKHKPDWQLINEFKMDAFAISTYPYMVYSIDDIPEDYYTQIQSHTSLKLIIAESGFATECCGKTIKDLHGSEQSQVKYLNFLHNSINRMNPLLWVYWSLYDYEPLSWGGTDMNDVFNSIGLRYSDGKEKPAYALWKKIYSLPCADDF